jgi:hypothetical protein
VNHTAAISGPPIPIVSPTAAMAKPAVNPEIAPI